MSRVDRSARAAVSVIFFTNGALFANLLPRLPEIKDDIGLSNAGYGAAVAAFAVGALTGGPFAGALSARLRSSRVAVAGTAVLAVMLTAAAVAPTALTFAAAMFTAGAADAVTDVAQNAHALRVQRRYDRSIINSTHAVWSVGAVTGGLMGAAAIAVDAPRAAHLSLSAVVCVGAAALAYRHLLTGSDHGQRAAGEGFTGRGDRRTVALLAGLVLVALAGAVVEDAGSSWATLYLRDDLGAPGAVAAFGYVAAMSAQLVGRLAGDPMVDRFGQRAVARVGAVLIAVGMGAAVALPGTAATIAGFAAAGFGSATLIPGAMREADALPGLAPNVGLTAVSWLLRVGSITSPLLVGVIADAAGLRVGLLVVPAAGLLVLVVAGSLSRTRGHG